MFARPLPPRRAFVLCAVVWIACGGPIRDAEGQQQGQPREPVPSTGYYSAFDDYYDGEYGDALKRFQRAGRGAIQAGPNRWIDSICYHAMIGECYYQMGKYDEALDQYTAAVRMYVTYNNWLISAQFQAALPPSADNRQPTWGRSTRGTRRALIPDTIPVVQSSPTIAGNQQRVVITETRVGIGINAKEIVRCTAIALRRRRELLGPAGPHDTLNDEAIKALEARPCQPNHWSESWIDLMLGLAYATAGKDVQATPLLNRALVVAGEFDHDLTAMALVELGRIALSQARFDEAAAAFEEATYAAFHYDDIGIMEEAFRYGQLTHLLANRPGLYPPLEIATGWARQERYDHLLVSLLLSAAENFLLLGDNQQAGTLLENVRPLISKADMGKGRVGARWEFLMAQVEYQRGKFAAGDAALARALQFQAGGGSLWLYHIATADRLYAGDEVSLRTAMELFATTLRDPAPADWLSDPLECLSVLSTPHAIVYEHWFDAALKRKENERALEIADELRRHRFLSTQPLGGRLLALRWLLDAPAELLDRQAVQERQDLLARHERLAELSQEANRLRGELAQMPLVLDDPALAREQADKLTALAAASAAQEAVLREVALRREGATILFPPRRTADEIEKALPKGHAMLVFLATKAKLYAFLIGGGKYEAWPVGSPAAVQKQIGVMLREWGNHEANSQVTLADLADDGWQKPARDLLAAIFKGTKNKLPEDLEELVIVPDGVLWHLPFEAIQLGDKADPYALITKTRVRYAPLASLGVPDGRGRRQSGTTAVVAGKLFPGADDAIGQAAYDDLTRAVPGAALVPRALPGPSFAYSSLIDQLIVLNDVPTEDGPYAWAPLSFDRGQPGSTLADWLSLPWRGPEQLILPGFHTAAENSLKKQSSTNVGEDVFLSVCGLMASGSRTILLSRWRTGGETSFDLVREFAQELPHTTAAQSWQRSVLLTMESPLDPNAEPRLTVKASDQPTNATHPFFWAGYLLVDSGTPPARPDKPAEEEAEDETK